MPETAGSPLSDDEFEQAVAGQVDEETRRLTAAYEVAELKHLYALRSRPVERPRLRPRVTRRSWRRWFQVRV